ncbi:hypothetical protein D9M71_351780 [compost metagenome]
MNQNISQRLTIIYGLRERAALPVQAPRYTVLPRGANTFEIIERATGQIKGQRFGHGNACKFAEQLESSTVCGSGGRNTIKGLGKTMLRWVMVMATTLVLFAHFGAIR